MCKLIAEWMHQVGCENVIELDWWEENCVPDKSDGTPNLFIHCTQMSIN
jgi:hypothetical protein